MTRADYVEASEKALSLFEYGQVIMMSKSFSNLGNKAHNEVPCHCSQ